MTPLTGREKATIFLSLLGAKSSARILRYLPDELADLIAAGINHLPTPSPDALSEVLDEFQSFVALPGATGPNTRQRLESAPPKPRKSYAILMYERPQMASFIISQLPKEEKRDALMGLPREKALIEELLVNLKSNLLSNKIAANLKAHYKGKLF